MKKCSICETEYSGYGNNAQPINDGECCDHCNMLVVIPTRLKELNIHIVRMPEREEK